MAEVFLPNKTLDFNREVFPVISRILELWKQRINRTPTRKEANEIADLAYTIAERSPHAIITDVEICEDGTVAVATDPNEASLAE